MKRVLIMAALLGGLAACQGGAMQTGKDLAQDAAAGIGRNLSASDLAALKQTCADAAPALATATAPGVPAPLKDTAVYPASFCRELLAGRANNADQSSLAWLPKGLALTQDLADVAQVLLPVALKALPLVLGAL